MKPKVSIIVPIYNVENYLERCFDSLLAQTLSDIEIIAINDGSTDNS
ncbi:glycosyltransferase [Anaerobacillus sp. CMMVII]|nr:glycosyltransferase [Anaerobacillus sp. CMMVII]